MGLFDRLFRGGESRVRDELARLQSKLESVERERDSINNQLKALQQSTDAEVDRLEDLLRDALSQKDKGDIDFKRISSSESWLKDELNRLQSKFESVIRERDSINNQLKALQLSTDAEVDRLEDLLRDAVSEKDEAELKFKRLSDTLNKARNDLVGAGERERLLQESLTEYTRRCCELESKHDALSSKIASFATTIAQKDKRIAALNAESELSKTADKTVSNTLSEVKAENRSLTRLLTDATAQISDLSKKLAVSDRGLATALVKIEMLEAEAEVFREQIAFGGRQQTRTSTHDAVNTPPNFLTELPYGRAETGSRVGQDIYLNLEEPDIGAPDDHESPWDTSLDGDSSAGSSKPIDVGRVVDSLQDDPTDLDIGDDWSLDDFEIDTRPVSELNPEQSVEYVESILNAESIFSDDYGPTTHELSTDRSSKVSRSGRANQIASALVDRYSLPPAALSTIASIFTENWWGSSRTAVINLLDRGASYQEVFLAFQLRQFWSSNGEFSTYFLESQEPALRKIALPWLVAFDFVRSFQGIPDIAELEQYLNESVEFWMSKRSLHYSYPSYLLYLKGIIASRRVGELIAPPRSTGRLLP